MPGIKIPIQTQNSQPNELEKDGTTKKQGFEACIRLEIENGSVKLKSTFMGLAKIAPRIRRITEMKNDMVVEEFDEMELSEAALQWMHLINWRLDCHDEDVKAGTDERATVDQSGMLHGQQKRLSEYADWLYPVVSIKGTEGSLSLCLISQQEQRRCKELLEIIGDGYGPDPDYVTDPQNCMDAKQNVGTPLGEYFTSGKAKEDFCDAHVEGYSHHYLQALRSQGEPTVWVESFDGEKPLAWAVCKISASQLQRPTKIDIVYDRPGWMPNKLFIALYLMDNHENTDTQ